MAVPSTDCLIVCIGGSVMDERMCSYGECIKFSPSGLWIDSSLSSLSSRNKINKLENLMNRFQRYEG
jgi:hypothetical protein